MKRSCLLLSLAALLPLGACAGSLDPFQRGGVTPAATSAAAAAPVHTADETPPRALYLHLVAELESEGKSHAALAYLDDYDRLYPGDQQAELLQAAALLKVGHSEAAAAVYRGLLPTALAAAAHDGLGQVSALRGDWHAARDQFRQAGTLAPTDAKFLNNYGYALLKLSAFSTAEFTLRQAAELAPGRAAIRDNLILCLHLEGKTAAADRLLQAKSADERRSVETEFAQWSASNAKAPVAQSSAMKEASP